MTVSITIVGNLTADPKFFTTKNGKGYALMTVADNIKGGDNGEDRAHFYRVKCWDGQFGFAKRVAETLKKGQRVIVSGVVDFYPEQVWVDDPDNDEEMKSVQRDVMQITAFNIGPDMVFQEVSVTKASGKDEASATTTTRKKRKAAATKNTDFDEDDF